MPLSWLHKKLHAAKNNVILQHLAAQRPAIEDGPFRHVIVDNALPEKFYRSLCQEFEKVKSRGLSTNTGDRERFSPMGKYDASVWSFPPHQESPLLFFYSQEWRDYLSNLFGIQCTDDINGCFHHHEINGQSGWVHNDYTAVTFVNAPKGKMNPWYHNCPSQTDVPLPGAHKGIRAIAILYYLNGSADWQEGDGGETGLYQSKELSSLVKKVAPLNNRLLVFEVSPASYHGFITNVKHERNSVIQWLHQDPKLSLKRFQVPHDRWQAKKPLILLTGASGKLGSDFAKKYSPYYDIIGVARHKPQSTEHFSDFFVYDITTDAQRIMQEIKEKHGMFDVLINNAVQLIPGSLLTKEVVAVRAEFETNLFAPYVLIQAAYRTFWQTAGKASNLQANRSIINISSIAGSEYFQTSDGIYSASKSALSMLTRHWATELKESGVRVNALAPAGFDNGIALTEVSLHLASLIEGGGSGEVKVLK